MKNPWEHMKTYDNPMENVWETYEKPMKTCGKPMENMWKPMRNLWNTDETTIMTIHINRILMCPSGTAQCLILELHVRMLHYGAGWTLAPSE